MLSVLLALAASDHLPVEYRQGFQAVSPVWPQDFTRRSEKSDFFALDIQLCMFKYFKIQLCL